MLSKKIVCLAVDDEPLALSILKKYRHCNSCKNTRLI
jgi:hypothetical protein